jgi:RNA polymerase sigma-70 factor (ECF subfamily)
MNACAPHLAIAGPAPRWQRARRVDLRPSPTPAAEPHPEADADREAMRRVAAGDRAALRGLYERLARRVQALGVHLLKDAAEAEDLVQETFVEVWRRREEYDPAKSQVVHWVLMMARSRALGRLRARESARRRDDAAAAEAGDAVEAPRALRAVEAREAREQVGAALAALPEEQRRCIELAYYEGLSQSEIAEAMHEPLGTVKTRVRRGLLRLGQLLRGGEETP